MSLMYLWTANDGWYSVYCLCFTFKGSEARRLFEEARLKAFVHVRPDTWIT